MSNQDRAAKARHKAFRKAALFLAKEQGYARTLEPSVLEEWLLSTSQRDKDTWTFVWDRALRYADRVHREQLDVIQAHLVEAQGRVVKIAADFGRVENNLIDVTETAKLRLAKIKAVETTAEDLEKKVLLQAGIIERQRTSTRTLIGEINGLRDRLTAARDERHRLTSLLADAEETIRSWEGIKKAVPRPPLAPCTATMSAHRCQARTRRGDQHADRHQCHCGVWWSGDGRGYHEPTHPVVPGR